MCAPPQIGAADSEHLGLKARQGIGELLPGGGVAQHGRPPWAWMVEPWRIESGGCALIRISALFSGSRTHSGCKFLANRARLVFDFASAGLLASLLPMV